MCVCVGCRQGTAGSVDMAGLRGSADGGNSRDWCKRPAQASRSQPAMRPARLTRVGSSRRQRRASGGAGGAASPDTMTGILMRQRPVPTSMSSSMRAPPVYRTSTTPLRSESCDGRARGTTQRCWRLGSGSRAQVSHAGATEMEGAGGRHGGRGLVGAELWGGAPPAGTTQRGERPAVGTLPRPARPGVGAAARRGAAPPRVPAPPTFLEVRRRMLVK